MKGLIFEVEPRMRAKLITCLNRPIFFKSGSDFSNASVSIWSSRNSQPFPIAQSRALLVFISSAEISSSVILVFFSDDALPQIYKHNVIAFTLHLLVISS